ncbi:MAG: RluA family pseudouridine synthase, partial [Thermicanus sp.]|nr:RluA family pseudouridine synthase [Thermicanus sp.]
METRLSFNVAEGEEGWQLKGYLTSKRISVTLLRRIKREGLLLLNGERATVHQRVAKGDLVEILFPDPPLPIVSPEPIPLSVLLEDEDLLLINKPAGIAVHPTRNYPSGTLANGISYYWGKKGEKRPVRLVHRLDKETSGIIVVAKHAYAQYFLSEGYRQGEYRKWYDLFVHGLLTEEEGFIEVKRLPSATNP